MTLINGALSFYMRKSNYIHRSHTIKVDTYKRVIISFIRNKNESTFLSWFKRYDQNFKRILIILYQTGKTKSELCKDYGISQTLLTKWIKQYSQVKLEENILKIAKPIQKFQKRNIQLKVGNLILKKASAIFMQNSKWDYKSFIGLDLNPWQLCSVVCYMAIVLPIIISLKRSPQREKSISTL